MGVRDYRPAFEINDGMMDCKERAGVKSEIEIDEEASRGKWSDRVGNSNRVTLRFRLDLASNERTSRKRYSTHNRNYSKGSCETYSQEDHQ